MRKSVLLLSLCILIILNVVILTNNKPKETTFDCIKIDYVDDLFVLRINNDLDTRYLNQKITVNVPFFVKGNELLIEENDNKINQSAIYIESYASNAKLEQLLSVATIEESKFIKVFTRFSLEYPFDDKRELFETTYVFEYNIIRNEPNLILLSETESTR